MTEGRPSWMTPISEDERAIVLEMRAELSDDLADHLRQGHAQHPELIHDWKLIRFLRGYKASVKDACKAYRAMLAFRVKREADAVRATMLADCPCAASAADGYTRQELLNMRWPYLLERFAPLLDGVWGGVSPVLHHKSDVYGNVFTTTVFSQYKFPAILAAGLGEEWLEMVLHCDCYFDLLLHAESVKRGCVAHGVVNGRPMQQL
jgi:hypothetical protein